MDITAQLMSPVVTTYDEGPPVVDTPPQVSCFARFLGRGGSDLPGAAPADAVAKALIFSPPRGQEPRDVGGGFTAVPLSGAWLLKGERVAIAAGSAKGLNFGSLVSEDADVKPASVAVISMPRAGGGLALRHEAEVAGWFNHRNIMPAPAASFDTVSSSHLVWKRYPHTFQSWLASEARSPKQLAHALEGVAEGLMEMHGKSVLHGDIHFGNVFMKSDGTAVLGDFGASDKIKVMNQRHTDLIHEIARGLEMDDMLAIRKYQRYFYDLDGQMHSLESYRRAMNSSYGLGRDEKQLIEKFFEEYFWRVDMELSPVGMFGFAPSETTARRVFGPWNEVFSFGQLCNYGLNDLIRRGKLKSSDARVALFRSRIEDMVFDDHILAGGTRYQRRPSMSKALEYVREFAASLD